MVQSHEYENCFRVMNSCFSYSGQSSVEECDILFKL